MASTSNNKAKSAGKTRSKKDGSQPHPYSQWHGYKMILKSGNHFMSQLNRSDFRAYCLNRRISAATIDDIRGLPRVSFPHIPATHGLAERFAGYFVITQNELPGRARRVVVLRCDHIGQTKTKDDIYIKIGEKSEELISWSKRTQAMMEDEQFLGANGRSMLAKWWPINRAWRDFRGSLHVGYRYEPIKAMGLMDLPRDLRRQVYCEVLGELIFPELASVTDKSLGNPITLGRGLRWPLFPFSRDMVPTAIRERVQPPDFAILSLNKAIRDEVVAFAWKDCIKGFADPERFRSVIPPIISLGLSGLHRLHLSMTMEGYIKLFGTNLPRLQFDVERVPPASLFQSASLRQLWNLRLEFPSTAFVTGSDIFTDPTSHPPCQTRLIEWIMVSAMQYIRHIEKVELLGFIRTDTREKWQRILASGDWPDHDTKFALQLAEHVIDCRCECTAAGEDEVCYSTLLGRTYGEDRGPAFDENRTLDFASTHGHISPARCRWKFWRYKFSLDDSTYLDALGQRKQLMDWEFDDDSRD